MIVSEGRSLDKSFNPPGSSTVGKLSEVAAVLAYDGSSTDSGRWDQYLGAYLTDEGRKDMMCRIRRAVDLIEEVGFDSPKT